MNRIVFAALVASAGFTAAAASPLSAQTGPAPQGDDAIVTRADALAAADHRFDAMDLKKDGKLTPDEIGPRGPMRVATTTPPPPAAGGTAPPPPHPGGRMFARLDTNSDGVVDREEYRAWALRRFDRMDTNHDGTIDAAERQAARDFRGQRGQRGGGGDMPPPPPPGAPDDKPGQ